MYKAQLKHHLSKGSPFLSSKFLIACIIFNLLVMTTAVLVLFTTHWFWVWLPSMMALAFTVYAWRYSRKPLITLALIDAALRKARVGEMHHRITGTAGLGEIGKVSWDLNDFLDLIESYFKEVNAAFGAVSKGDFSRKALSKGMPGEFSRSLQSINQSIDAMQANRRFTEQNRLASQLHELNTGNLRSNLQLSQQDLQQISKQMSGIAEKSNKNAANALQSQANARELGRLLEQILASVQRVSTTVAELNQHTTAVSGALQSIADISDQTNLLALNASIEAARAGEQGRGFAVVADEVKQLSTKTKTAAESIASILNNFSEQVDSSLAGAQESQEIAARVSSEVEGFQQRFAEVAEDAETTQSQVALIKDLSFASLLKIDHILGKQLGYAGLNANVDRDAYRRLFPERLERWLERSQTTEMARHQAFERIQEEHQQVQQAIQEAWVEYAETGIDARENIVNFMEIAETSSRELMAAIDALVADRHL